MRIQTQITGIAATMYGQLVSRLTRPIAGAIVVGGQTHVATIEPERGHEAALFARAVQEDSNLEMDWLWLATRVSGSEERRYCMAKVLAINPESEPARRALGLSADHRRR